MYLVLFLQTFITVNLVEKGNLYKIHNFDHQDWDGKGDQAYYSDEVGLRKMKVKFAQMPVANFEFQFLTSKKKKKVVV